MVSPGKSPTQWVTHQRLRIGPENLTEVQSYLRPCSCSPEASLVPSSYLNNSPHPESAKRDTVSTSLMPSQNVVYFRNDHCVSPAHLNLQQLMARKKSPRLAVWWWLSRSWTLSSGLTCDFSHGKVGKE